MRARVAQGGGQGRGARACRSAWTLCLFLRLEGRRRGPGHGSRALPPLCPYMSAFEVSTDLAPGRRLDCAPSLRSQGRLTPHPNPPLTIPPPADLQGIRLSRRPRLQRRRGARRRGGRRGGGGGGGGERGEGGGGRSRSGGSSAAGGRGCGGRRGGRRGGGQQQRGRNRRWWRGIGGGGQGAEAAWAGGVSG